ncbi:LysR family transcriptional regulator [Aquabacterium sp. J223]|uniref:LysR family transcriptional regulator n=1 Tax=Aquabacterium sp. J223 TaxID=2898431 RepID=UPI0021AD6527|nr:LysR family transcriptional regulator [Aquabacterium sp. J223]UUX95497.1 LysR family transcriptional regulator [Aquabacterium sp. J223]
MDKLLAMQAFVRVVEAGTFSRAADTLSLPKPTVTRLVQRLEADLQTKLLNRTTRRVTVTADGAAYYDRAMRLLSELEELESSLSKAKANPRGRLRIDAGTAVAQLLLIPALPDFHARYPDIQIDLGVSDRPVDLIGENVDCVLRGGELTDQSLVARRIGNFHTLVCATPGYLERHGMPQHPRDIEEGEHVVVNHFSPRTGRIFPFVFERGEERLEVVGRHRLSINDSNAGLTAALAGLGLVNTATFMAQPYIQAGLLRPVLVDWCSESVPIHVVYPPNRHLSAKLRVFVDWVAELFSRSDEIQRQCSLPGCMAAAAAAGAARPVVPSPVAAPAQTAAVAAAAQAEALRAAQTLRALAR